MGHCWARRTDNAEAEFPPSIRPRGSIRPEEGVSLEICKNFGGDHPAGQPNSEQSQLGGEGGCVAPKEKGDQAKHENLADHAADALLGRLFLLLSALLPLSAHGQTMQQVSPSYSMEGIISERSEDSTGAPAGTLLEKAAGPLTNLRRGFVDRRARRILAPWGMGLQAFGFKGLCRPLRPRLVRSALIICVVTRTLHRLSRRSYKIGGFSSPGTRPRPRPRPPTPNEIGANAGDQAAPKCPVCADNGGCWVADLYPTQIWPH